MKRLLSRGGFALGLGAALAFGSASLAKGPPDLILTNPTPTCSTGNCYAAPAVAPAPSSEAEVERLWFRADYLLWWLKPFGAPTLLTTSPATVVPLPGTLDNPNTTVLVSGSSLVDNPFSGGRFQAGAWLDEEGKIGFEGSFFFLASQNTNTTISSPGTPVLTRPYFDTVSGQQRSEIIAFPGVAAGTFGLNTSSELWGFEANGVATLCRTCEGAVYLIGGFRQLHLHETLGITEDIQVDPASNVFPGSRIGVLDRFRTTNDFYGGQLGARAEYRLGQFVVGAVAKVALGVVHQDVQVQGSTRIAPPVGAAFALPGGLLALPSNSGSFVQDRFGVLPEGGVTLGYQVTDNIRVNAGYTFLYLNNVARPGDQVSLRINDSQVPTNILTNGNLVGAPAPVGGVRTSDVWVQGLTFGVELKF